MLLDTAIADAGPPLSDPVGLADILNLDSDPWDCSASVVAHLVRYSDSVKSFNTTTPEPVAASTPMTWRPTLRSPTSSSFSSPRQRAGPPRRLSRAPPAPYTPTDQEIGTSSTQRSEILHKSVDASLQLNLNKLYPKLATYIPTGLELGLASTHTQCVPTVKAFLGFASFAAYIDSLALDPLDRRSLVLGCQLATMVARHPLDGELSKLQAPPAAI